MPHCRTIFAGSLIIAALLLSGCGAVGGAQTPATPTPTVTPAPFVPTAAPVDLTVSVTDAEGTPLAGAQVVLPESRDDAPVLTDASGQAAWTLAANAGTLTVSAQGYSSAEQAVTLQPGPNEVVVALERNPLAILPSEACQPGQEVLYVEDFEDGQAQGWPNVAEPLWRFEQEPERGTFLTADSTGGLVHSPVNDVEVGNAVWEFDMRAGNFIIMNWHQSVDGRVRYLVVYSPPEPGLQIFHNDEGQGGQVNEAVRPGLPAPPAGTWQHFAITYFNGVVDVWIDGTLMLSLDDQAAPVERGGISFEVHEDSGVFSYDNIVLCGLSAPYQPPAPDAAS